MKKGYIQVYTGNGKGKTTAALGLALRAAGAGLKIFIAQFLKGKKYSEHNSLKKIKNISLKLYGRECFIKKSPTKEDIEAAMKGWEQVKKIILNKKYDVCILDELNIAIYYNLISENEVVNFLKTKPDNIEIVITGRNATKKIMRLADLVTDMKEVKHYYKSGVEARRGIEM